MEKRIWRWMMALLAGAFLTGGCGIAEFRLPERFNEGKQVEDPPGVRAPLGADKAVARLPLAEEGRS